MSKEITSLPKWAERFLHAICPEELCDEIEGDLIETFNHKSKKAGTKKANVFLFFNVIQYARPAIVFRNKFNKPAFNTAIIGNYILTSYRHVLKDKVNSAFKIAGMTLALFSLLVVSLYVSYQLSFDKYHNGYERIYRVNTQRSENGNLEQYGIAPIAIGPMLKDGFPEVESYARFESANGSHVKYRDKVVYGGIFAVDSTWFDIFNYEFLAGSPGALNRPGTIVVTETLSKKIFGADDPLEKVVTINNEKTLYTITAVIKDIPHNSHIAADAFVSINRKMDFSAQQIISPVEFVDNSVVLFVKLLEGAKSESFTEHIEKSLDQYVGKKQRDELGFKIFLQPLKDIYLDPPLKYEFTKKGNIVYLYIFLILGLFLLLISCINYANLSLAGFMNRSREIGVRKVLGGRKSQVIMQVTLDTLIYCLTAFISSLILVRILFPKILEYIDPDLDLSIMTTQSFILIIGAILLMFIVISAAIPALWFVNNKVINDLKGAYSPGGKLRFNNSLLLVQFMISAICISATLTVGKQISFIHDKDLGINRKDLLVLSMSEDFSTDKMIALKSSLKSIAGVTHVSNSSFRMGGGYWKDWYTVEIGNEMKSLELYEVFSDDELFETLGMKVLKGRTFDADHKADSGAAFVINETAARAMGFDDPVGTKILTHPEEPGKWEGTIVGVVNDINISTLHHKVQPLVMRLPWQNRYPEYFVYVRIDGPAKDVIASIKKRYNELQPGYPLEIYFVDDFYNHEYQRENRAYASLQFATIIILLISSLGIFSLSIFLSARRMKEFGIRKVLGATAEQITYMHVLHFVRIAAISFLIAIPVAYLLMNEWLKSFAYKVTQDAVTAVIVLSATFLLIVLSAGYSAIRAGMMNPIKVINKV